MQGIGDRIKRAREALGMNQTELAHRMGALAAQLKAPKLKRHLKTYWYISTWENGKTATLRVYDLMALALVLGVSTDWLCGLVGDRDLGGTWV